MKASDTILELISSVVVPATTDNFVAKDNFVVNESSGAPVKFGSFSCEFYDRFLGNSIYDYNNQGLIERPTGKKILYYSKLLKESSYTSIIEKLDGFNNEKNILTTLFGVFYLMKKQGKGENGVLLNNGDNNIFFVLGRACVTMIVRVAFIPKYDKWSVGARDFYQGDWVLLAAGSQVFFPVLDN